MAIQFACAGPEDAGRGSCDVGSFGPGGFDLSQWIAANPIDVLVTNFSQPPELFEKLPHRDVFIAGWSGPGK
jgi:hypothetical protein